MDLQIKTLKEAKLPNSPLFCLGFIPTKTTIAIHNVLSMHINNTLSILFIPTLLVVCQNCLSSVTFKSFKKNCKTHGLDQQSLDIKIKGECTLRWTKSGRCGVQNFIFS